MKTGLASFPLDHGTCPKWLFDKTLDVIEKGIKKAQISFREKEKALQRFMKSL